nr:RNA-directed DNA polymerase, eukaryota [Tanacetum cinerariifolium]
MFHERTKHINVRYHFIKEIVESKEIEVAKIGTKDNAAVAFTKVVRGLKFKYCMEILSPLPDNIPLKNNDKYPAFPLFSFFINGNAKPTVETSSPTNVRALVLNDQDLTSVEDPSKVLLVKLKDVNSMSNITAQGRSGGLISIWDLNSFVKEYIWCDDAFTIVKGHWMNAYILFGDMNVVRNKNKRCGTLFSRQNADHFNFFIDNSGLIDLPLGGRLFTLTNKAGTKLCKINYFLISNDVVEALPDVCVTAIDRFWSGHNPILLHVTE